MPFIRRIIIVFLCVFGLFTLLAACNKSRPLVVGLSPWIGYETIYLAQNLNWLPADVQLFETADLSGTAHALRSGKIDAACITLDEVLNLRAVGIPLTVVLVFDVSAGADVVLARSTVHQLSDLKGKRIGIEQNTLGALMLTKLLSAAGLEHSQVTVVDCPAEKQVEAWQNNEIDAVITYGPTVALLQRQGGVCIFDSRHMADTVFDVLAVNTAHTELSSVALEKLVAAHFRALKHLQTNRQDAIFRIAAHLGTTPEEANLALAGVMLPSLAANYEYLVSGSGRITKSSAEFSTLMLQHGLLKVSDSLENIATSACLPRD